MPYGVNFFTTIGYSIGDVLRYYNSKGKDGKSPAEAAEFLAKSFTMHLNPFGGMQIFEGGVASLQAISPSMIDPLIQIATNTNWKGGAMRPENVFDGAKEEATPDSTKYFAGQEDSADVKIARWLSTITGGDGVKQGMIEIAPSSLNAIMQAAFGGVWSMGKLSAETAGKLSRGEETTMKDYPVIRKMIGGLTASDYRTAYQDHADEIKGALHTYKTYLEKGEFNEAKAYYRDNLTLIEDGVKVKMYDDMIKKLRTQRNMIFASKSLSEEVKIERLKDNKDKVLDTLQKALHGVEN
jgi:hypothetical protein